ncbi:serine/threonine protein kinase [Nostoc commune NIES-4072]|uniref:non-specific serine/threonine protein kinase n=1 Tax=Nostoc commune NIES-4072 TaxID=2005467 RepID=A0A2R5FU59_NOSCO|nr:serine/threonine-protein kinase [Nostoc commune]BBD68008.1 serine/threonine protein kinase [Nostoc commune HK-02]GBG20998.1 serine/threonine protein kinase [Nostoc commune NIES-4072]
MELDVRNGHKGAIPLNHHPDFSKQGYQVISELGRNREGGRITYLANVLNSKQQVVIKEFCFARVDADLSGVKAYQREIEILQQLNHSRIPRYLDSFEIPGAFYLVQEYKKAPSLGLTSSFNPEEIKQIALSILEILVYLQKQIPPIIHRDIKPENILVDEQLNAYLVDFGLARIQGAKVALSSFVAGTPGFMPPEEQFGHSLTEASDLYSLGATLICLLTNTRSVEIGKLIDDNYCFKCQQLVPQISPRFRSWLMKMVERKRKRRYANAAVALEALGPIQVIGNATKIDTLIKKIIPRKRATLLGLATIITLVAMGATLISCQRSNTVRQLLEATECQSFDLNASCQEKTGD